jgi:hypothetical protein
VTNTMVLSLLYVSFGSSPLFMANLLAFHQFHLGDHGSIIFLIRDLEGVLYLLGVVQATNFVVFVLT